MLLPYQFVNEDSEQNLFAFRFFQEQLESSFNDFFLEMQQCVVRTELSTLWLETGVQGRSIIQKYLEKSQVLSVTSLNRVFIKPED